MHVDNSAHLIDASRERHARARQRALDTLDRLEERGTPLTVSGFARAAGVARSWIYTQPDILARTHALRRSLTPSIPGRPDRSPRLDCARS